MQTFTTYAEYLGACTKVQYHKGGSVASYMPPTGPFLWKCSDCGSLFPQDTPHALRKGVFMVCYGCSHKRDLGTMNDRAGPFGAYISSDGNSVSNWPGGILGRVVSESAHRGNFGGMVHCYTIRDVHGGYWHGRNAGPGMCITLRPSKN